MSKPVFPLTTVFAPPPGCGTVIPAPILSNDTFATQLSSSLSQGCFPPHFAEVYHGNGWYSPGICPYGYEVSYSQTTGTMVAGETLKPSETGAYCALRYGHQVIIFYIVLTHPCLIL